MTPSVSHLRAVDYETDHNNRHVGIDVTALTVTPVLRSSFQYRRLVIGGHVVLDPVTLAKPAMRAREVGLFTSLATRSKSVVEYGSGGSTALLLKLGVSRIVSVESDADWINRLLADEAVRRAADDGRVSLVHADIGPTGFMGKPTLMNNRENWPQYAKAPWDHIDADQLDLVFIDGRFRVACILETILRVGPNTLIAVHDFWNRPHYHTVLPFLEDIRKCQSLGVFRVKPNIDIAKVRAMLDVAYFIPA